MAFKTVIRVTKLGTVGNLKASGEHTWRERKTDNADPEKTHLNEDWREVKSSAELVDAVQTRVAQAEQKSDTPVICIEYLITANKDAFKEGGGKVDSSEYFADSLKWLEAKHGKENIVAVNIQRDEQAPHMVAYVVPLVEVEAKTRKRSVVVGKDAEGKQIREVREYKDAPTVRLSAAEFLNGRQKLRDLQTDFSKAVGEKHGLERGVKGSKAKHQTIKQFYTHLNDTEKVFNVAKNKASRVDELEKQGAIRQAADEQIKAGIQALQKQVASLTKQAEMAAKDKAFTLEHLEKLKTRPAAQLPTLIDEIKKRLPSEAEKPKNTPAQTPQKER
jgi:hypothetical protein